MRAPTYPPKTEPAAKSSTATQSQVGHEEKDHARDQVRGNHCQRLERVEDAELQVGAEPSTASIITPDPAPK